MSEPVGHILYDGNCGFCQKWVSIWEPVFKRRGLETAPLQDDWVRDQFNMDDEELLRDFRLLMSDGRSWQGAQAYRQVMKLIWWAWPIWFLSRIPGLSHLFDFCYRKFADNRHRISSACRLDDRRPGSN